MAKESNLEKRACRWAKAHGWRAEKLAGANVNGRQDRVFLRAIPVRQIVYVEFKAPGETMTPLQSATREKAMEDGFISECVDNFDAFLRLMKPLTPTDARIVRFYVS